MWNTPALFAFLSHAILDQNRDFMLMPLVILGILSVSYTNKGEELRTNHPE